MRRVIRFFLTSEKHLLFVEAHVDSSLRSSLLWLQLSFREFKELKGVARALLAWQNGKKWMAL